MDGRGFLRLSNDHSDGDGPDSFNLYGGAAEDPADDDADGSSAAAAAAAAAPAPSLSLVVAVVLPRATAIVRREPPSSPLLFLFLS